MSKLIRTASKLDCSVVKGKSSDDVTFDIYDATGEKIGEYIDN